MGDQKTMEELILVGLVGFGGGVITTAALVLLVVIYNNINSVSDKLKDDDENAGFVMPMSALMGGGQRQPLTMADLQAYAAASAAGAGAPGDTKKAEGGGTYL